MRNAPSRKPPARLNCIMYGKMPTDAQVKAYALACMAVKSTTRDLENCMEIAATVAAEEA